jgi:hypothetical protein
MVSGQGFKMGLGVCPPILSELARICLAKSLTGRVLRQAFRMGGHTPKPLYGSQPQDHGPVAQWRRMGKYGRSISVVAFPFFICLFSAFASQAATPGLGVVKYAKGNLKVTQADSAQKDMVPSTLISGGSKIESGKDGKAVIRLLPDQAFMEVRPQSALTLKRVKTKDKRVRRVTLDAGEVVFGLKKKSEPVQCENIHTQATVAAGRFSCRSDEKGVGIFLVQDGEMSVYNRPKDLTAVVRSGQKAVSDLNGIKVTDATDSELEQVGFRQNTVEVDFLNPQTEEFTTLEVEYETNF